jgi:hypothetical protein
VIAGSSSCIMVSKLHKQPHRSGRRTDATACWAMIHPCRQHETVASTTSKNCLRVLSSNAKADLALDNNPATEA